MNDRAVIVGGGGHAACLVEYIGLSGSATIVGYVAPERGRLSELGIEYLGTDAARRSLYDSGVRHAVLGVAGARGNSVRRSVFAQWSSAGFMFLTIRHPSAIVSPTARCGDGLQAFAGSVVNSHARIGQNVIVNSNATVEHDCELGDHVHVAPGATLCGGVRVGEASLIGAGSVVLPGVSIGRDVVVAAGATVVHDVADGTKVRGVAASAFGGLGEA